MTNRRRWSQAQPCLVLRTSEPLCVRSRSRSIDCVWTELILYLLEFRRRRRRRSFIFYTAPEGDGEVVAFYGTYVCHRWWRGPIILRRSTISANQIWSCVGVIVAVGFLRFFLILENGLFYWGPTRPLSLLFYCRSRINSTNVFVNLITILWNMITADHNHINLP